jgi:cytochrome c-type biogenesis protein CcmH/NrfF
MTHTGRMVVLAHAGHWLIWVLYAVPVLIVIGSIVISIARQRREADTPKGSDPL